MQGRLRAPCSLFGLGSPLGCYSVVRLLLVRLRAVLLGHTGRRIRLPLATPAPPPAGVRLRRGQVVGQGVCDLLNGAELFACGIEMVVGARRVALGRGEQ